MVDTVRTLTALATLLADNKSGQISPQDVRDLMVSLAQIFKESGGTEMTLGAVADNEYLRRSGTTVVGKDAARIKVSTYVGDGTLSKAITGVGFSPAYVRIWEHEVTAQNIEVVEATKNMIDDDGPASIVVKAASVRVELNKIIAFGTDGFTVDDDGIDAHPNKLNQIYNYMVIG